MGQIIAQEGFTPRYLRGELLMAHEEEGTEVSLGKIEVIKTLSEAGFRRWIVKRGNEMIYERDAAAYERGYCGV